MKILGDVLKLAAQYLKERNDSNPRRHAEDLLSYVLKEPRLNLYLQFDRPLQEDELSTYRALLKRKATGEPVEYICGELAFFGCSLLVTPDVLIPRPETEVLLEKAADQIKDLSLAGKYAWDICCGSGCIGLGLKKRFPELSVTLSDLSEQAILVAKENCKRNQLDVEFLCGDLLSVFQGRKADFVFCNPPYISKKEFDSLDRSVKDFEPALALLGSESGLLFYERLSSELPGHLQSGARVFLEIGTGQGEAVLDIFNAGHWKAKKVEKDWAGHDRFFFLEFE
ncbi:MAG: peptide chain release factor N(5)-glutamine methyltransferase [Verrucomicrobia bacterium]|nr:peptide chain release factor N(5)-glutamine methyltransferase [Verrucomicrobiota bacterium]